jgi:hypothetical protein
MDLDGMGKEISRRKMLKRIGAGAAIAWTAPVLTSLRTPAFAQRYQACPTCGGGCEGQGPACGESGPFAACLCNIPSEGGCFCYELHSCLEGTACTSTADCAGFGAGDWRCITTCCGTVCRPPCGTNLPESADASGRTDRG